MPNRDWDNCASPRIKIPILDAHVFHDNVPRSFKIVDATTVLVHTSAGAGNNRFTVEKWPVDRLRAELQNMRKIAERERDDAQGGHIGWASG